MNRLAPRYRFVFRSSNMICLKDLGPWDQYPTLTNRADYVVKSLVDAGELEVGTRLFYQDSEGDLAEMVWSPRGGFERFLPLFPNDPDAYNAQAVFQQQING